MPLCHLFAKNWWKFVEVLPKTILHSFLRHSVYCDVLVAVGFTCCQVTYDCYHGKACNTTAFFGGGGGGSLSVQISDGTGVTHQPLMVSEN